jgi:CRP/FNR family cyclic AMP-dependent transcriptional regulator
MTLEPYLKDFQVFDGLDCDAARKLGHRIVDRQYPAGQLIFSADERAEYVYLIRLGRIKLFRQTEDGRENTVAILGPGDVFGEFVLGENSCHSVYAQALELSLLCILPRRNFFQLLVEEPAIALTIINNIGKRLAFAAQSIEHLSTYDLGLRLGKLLLLLADEHGQGSEHALTLKIRLTHQDIANMAATSRQTVTQLMNQFKQLGLLRYDRHQIVVNRPQLTQFLQRNR